jgi:pimeloyl-ACP methyl ester carboxylesterase
MPASVRVSDATIALDEYSGAGSAVLLLHGFPATRRLWAQVAPQLCDAGFRVIVPDLVGYGASESAAGVRVGMAAQARWMWELMDALGIKRVTVIAHDVGSAAGQLMTVTAPHRVRGLAVLDGVYADEWAMDAIESIRTWDPSQAHRLSPVLVRRLRSTAGMRELLKAYEGEQGGRQLIRAACALDPSETKHIGAALRASAVPAMVLWGERDQFLPIDTVARPLARLLGAAVVLLPGAHFTPLDCPAEVAAALREFLATLR